MLQAATGKLFTYEVSNVNLLRGVLYTNMALYMDDGVSTVFGKFYGASSGRKPNTLYCEITEHIESTADGPGVLVSNNINVYIDDFADVISFGLGVICTPDAGLAQRLLNENFRPGSVAPQKLVSKIYEDNVFIKKEEFDDLAEFCTNLLGLTRKQYLVAIKAIRTYVTALHRMGDNLDLAYTLLVMSIEALIADAPTNSTNWSDVEKIKRTSLESVFERIDPDAAEEIKRIIIEREHHALSKKFNSFIESNIPDDFFSTRAATQTNPVGKADLHDALPNLYVTRSKYVHELKALPREFYHFQGAGEVAFFDCKLMLTFQGLTRLARDVIKEFIRKQDKLEAEPTEYFRENPNIAFYKLGPTTWINNPHGVTSENINHYYSGFLEILDRFLRGYPNAVFYDMRAVIEHAFTKKGKMSEEQRTSLISLTFLFEAYVGKNKSANVKISKQDKKLLESASTQMLIYYMAVGIDTNWDVLVHEHHLSNYYTARLKPNGLRLPLAMEACLGIAFSEKLRLTGEHERAISTLAETADNYPSIKIIRDIVQNYSPDTSLSWIGFIYPRTIQEIPRATLECNGL